MADEQEIAAARMARDRRDDISRQIHGLLTVWQANDYPADQDLINTWDALWADHHTATLRYEALNGLVSPELADLRWRDYRAFFTALAPVDPAVPLTDSERATLDRLEAAHQVKLDDRRASRETLKPNPPAD